MVFKVRAFSLLRIYMCWQLKICEISHLIMHKIYILIFMIPLLVLLDIIMGEKATYDHLLSVTLTFLTYIWWEVLKTKSYSAMDRCFKLWLEIVWKDWMHLLWQLLGSTFGSIQCYWQSSPLTFSGITHLLSITLCATLFCHILETWIVQSTTGKFMVLLISLY